MVFSTHNYIYITLQHLVVKLYFDVDPLNFLMLFTVNAQFTCIPLNIWN